MIVAKTRMRKIPKTCKDCGFGKHDFGGDRICVVTGKDCPMDLYKGNWKYGKPAWCPLVMVEKLEETDQKAGR